MCFVQVALTVHVAMTAYQSVIYDWVKATGTLRLSPYDPRIGKSHRHNFAPLNNKCMELRKVTPIHTVLQPSAVSTNTLLHQTCGTALCASSVVAATHKQTFNICCSVHTYFLSIASAGRALWLQARPIHAVSFTSDPMSHTLPSVCVQKQAWVAHKLP